MPQVNLIKFLVLSTIAGATASLLVSSTPIQAEGGCGNTYCEPEDTSCSEYTGWECTLSGGCAGNERCD